jgi:hypothetical protein
MRTTLTLDPDVESLLKRSLKAEHLSLKETVNRALREGLTRLAAPPPTTTFRTRTADLGHCRLNRIDDVAEALALAEGEAFR